MRRSLVLLLPLLAASLPFVPLSAQNTLNAPDVSGPVSTTLTLTIALDNNAGSEVDGYAYGLCSDPALVTVVSIEPGADLLTAAQGLPDFYSVQPVTGGYTVACLLDFFDANHLPTGNGLEIDSIEYSLDAAGITALDFCKTLGNPPTEIDIVVGGLSFMPALDSGSIEVTGACTPFVRSDANGDFGVNINDSISILSYLAQGGAAPPDPLDRADVNDDGGIDIADAMYLKNFLFMLGAAPPAPYPSTGCDPTPNSDPPSPSPAVSLDLTEASTTGLDPVTIDVLLDSQVEVEAFSLAMSYETASLSLADFHVTGTVTEPLLGTEFVVSEIFEPQGGAVLFVVMELSFSDVTIPPGNGQVIARLDFLPDIIVDTPVLLPVTFADGIFQTPPTSNVLSSAGIALFPQTTGGSVELLPIDVSFIRGDASGDGSLAVDDAVVLLEYLFLDGPAPCLDALDTSDDDQVSLQDAFQLLCFLFCTPGGPAPPAPFPLCGPDPTALAPLTCATFTGCP